MEEKRRSPRAVCGVLAQRRENFHQFALDGLVAADDIAGRKRGVAALDAANGAARFAHHDDAGREIPRLEVTFPIAVEAARGDARHVERSRADAAQARDTRLQYGHLTARQLMVAAPDVG